MAPCRVTVVIATLDSLATVRTRVDDIFAADYPAEIVGVLSNRADAAGLAFAAGEGIETAIRSHADYADRRAFDLALDSVLTGWGAEIVALASSTPVTVTDQANGLDITLTGQDITINYDFSELSTTTPASNDVVLLYDVSVAGYRTTTAAQIASLGTPAPDITKVTKGGDTDAAIHQMELGHKFDFISTGGGAFLALLEGDTLPALKALEE